MTITTTPQGPCKSIREFLDRKGIRPLHIERTEKRAGDMVLTTWARPAERVGSGGMLHDRSGRFVRRVG